VRASGTSPLREGGGGGSQGERGGTGKCDETGKREGNSHKIRKGKVRWGGAQTYFLVPKGGGEERWRGRDAGTSVPWGRGEEEGKRGREKGV